MKTLRYKSQFFLTAMFVLAMSFRCSSPAAVYTNRSEFIAACQTLAGIQSPISFDSYLNGAPYGQPGWYSGQLTVSNVTFSGNIVIRQDAQSISNEIALNNYDMGVPLAVHFPNGALAFGADFSSLLYPYNTSNFTATISIQGGSNYTFSAEPGPGKTFFGIVETNTFSDLTFSDGGAFGIRQGTSGPLGTYHEELVADAYAVQFVPPLVPIVLSVDARCNIYGAGHPSAPDNAPTVGTHSGGLPPVMVTLGALTNAASLVFHATGNVSYCPVCGNNGPDGADFLFNAPSYKGISGITNSPGRSLVGVFTSDVEPVNPAPTALDFGVIGTNYATLAPQLRQQFFIGDGLTSVAGGVQTVRVPAGATRLYLGFVDGTTFDNIPDWYEDNTGSLSVTVASAFYLDIKYSAGKPLISVFSAAGFTNRIEYATTLSPANWTPLTNVVLTGIPTLLYDASASGDKARFYRAFQWP
ncbi:MAG: hypothetical protein WDM80_13545 [Limisphaerales bacterium]